MPIFEYKCRDCDFSFEKLVKDPEVKVVCPNCKKTNNKKLISNISSGCSGCSGCSNNCSGCSRDF
ncbi:zinc ribbon domain-containing protein [Patescibacteria group bacterium]|nr:zinc ribbon domain-containing protein [Patescibacteria group bacterium]